MWRQYILLVYASSFIGIDDIDVPEKKSLIARLGNYLPPGRYLGQLAMGLAVGKVSHAIAAATTPRLVKTVPATHQEKAIQVALNDVARTVTGSKRTDHVTVANLLEKARIPSFNRLAAVAAAIKTLKAFHSRNGKDGERNPIGKCLFNQARCRPRLLRSETAGEVQVPLRGCKSLVNTAATIWNRSPALRAAKTLSEAKVAAKTIPI
jgi:hypothetical protein